MKRRRSIDLRLITPIIFLLILSTTMLRSVVPQDTTSNILFAIGGITAYLLLSRIDYHAYLPFTSIIYALTLAALIGTFIFGEETRGSTRWIRIGSLTLQTSELIKPFLLVSLSALATKLNFQKLSHIMKYVILMSIPVILVFLQPDLGSAMVLTIIGLSIAFARGIPKKTFLAIVILGLVSLPILYNVLQPYQKQRLQTFTNPFSDPLGSGYSVIQAMIAVGSGKFIGRGLGHGTQSQLRFLPERHTDFIFASVAEELGFVGTMLVLTSYTILFISLLKVAKEAPDISGNLIVLGVFSMILFQFTINIGMNLGLLPVTGITLPLISSGGSSLLATMISLGIVQSISSQRKHSFAFEIG